MKPQELQVVGWVAAFIESIFGVVPGSWTERDGLDRSGLTVDVTFEDADPPPPFAVEVTRLRDDFEQKLDEVAPCPIRGPSRNSRPS